MYFVDTIGCVVFPFALDPSADTKERGVGLSNFLKSSKILIYMLLVGPNLSRNWPVKNAGKALNAAVPSDLR